MEHLDPQQAIGLLLRPDRCFEYAKKFPWPNRRCLVRERLRETLVYQDAAHLVLLPCQKTIHPQTGTIL